MGQEREKKRTVAEFIPGEWLLIFILFLAILGTYYPSLAYPFLNLDDPYYINFNPYIRDLTWKGIYRIFSQPIVDNYFPLQILTYALDYQIWHIQPFGYRLHNIVLHILNAVLVFYLLKRIFSNRWVSFLSALFFGLHPVNVESVTWVAERKNVLSLAFMLASFLSYLSYLEAQRRARRTGFYLAALSFFLLALLAKVSAVILPLLLLLFDFCFLRKGKWEMVRDKLPFLALSILFSFVAVWVYRRGGVLVDYHGGSPYLTFLAMTNVFVEYIIYLAVPVYLDHLYWTPIPQSILEYQVLLSMGAILLFVFLAWRSFRKDRTFFFWFGWFFISLLPVLNIVPLIILRADRYMYLPAIGFFYLVTWGLWKICQGEKWLYRVPVFFSCVLLLAGAYSFLTLERNKLWRDSIVFWEETLSKFPQSATAVKFIGNIYTERGKPDLAISYFQAGLRETPNEIALLNGLAMAYKNKSELQRAEDLLMKANRLNPRDSETCNNLGTIYFQRGDLERSRAYLQKAIELNPHSAPPHANLGLIFYNLNQEAEAIRELEKAMELSPSSVEPYLNLALLYEQKRLWQMAEFYLKKALDYAPDSHAVLFKLGMISFEQGKIPPAEYYLSQAYRVNPEDRETSYFLRLIAHGKGNRALQSQPQPMGPSIPNP